MTRTVTDFGASARARLLNLTKRRQGDFQLTLQRYVAERFLYRLGVSRHRERFVLKGAMLFVLWDDAIARPTRDLDLAGYWANDAASLQATIREICEVPSPGDGLQFAMDTSSIAPIRDATEYHGFRINFEVLLSGAVIPFQVDVGFGDAIVPEPVDVVYPVLLDAPPPRIRAYPREAAVAEKLHAMVTHGDANTRFKDFWDVQALSARFAFAGPSLADAIRATFSRRKSATLTPWPVALTPAFYADRARADQWTRYVQRSRLPGPRIDFAAVGERVIAFLEPAARAVSAGDEFERSWQPQGPWR